MAKEGVNFDLILSGLRSAEAEAKRSRCCVNINNSADLLDVSYHKLTKYIKDGYIDYRYVNKYVVTIHELLTLVMRMNTPDFKCAVNGIKNNPTALDYFCMFYVMNERNKPESVFIETMRWILKRFVDLRDAVQSAVDMFPESANISTLVNDLDYAINTISTFINTEIAKAEEQS